MIKKILIGLVVLVMTFFIIRGIIIGEREYNRDIPLIEENIILNYSPVEYADTLSHLGLQYLNVQDVNIVILKAQEHVMKNILRGETVDGFVIKDGDTYQMFLNPNMSRSKSIEIISHELIHIHQKHTGKLKVLNSDIAIFDGETISIKDTPYRERPWEVEAYRQQRKVENFIRDTVF